MINDPIADMLTRIRNGQKARLLFIHSPYSKIRTNILEVLKTEGYIRDYSVESVRTNISEIKIELKYNNLDAAIRKAKRVSKPGRRVYSKITDLPLYFNGLGITILSTPKGILADHQARTAKVGGEILCQIF